MGTRHLIAVKIDGEYKIAQYGQWDGYPEGQGLSVLRFFKTHDHEIFIDKLKQCSFYTKEEIDSIYDNINDSNVDDFFKNNRWLSRDAGSDILDYVYNSENGLKLVNSIDFAGDSLFCEWAYVIDFDKLIFEIYQGFNKERLVENDRFYNAPKPEHQFKDEYYPIKIVGAWWLNVLPDEETFLNFLKIEEEEE